MTSGSGYVSHPVPVAPHIRFRLRIIFGIGCTLLTVPVSQIFPVSVSQLIPAAVSVTSGPWCVVGKTRSAAKNAVSVFTSVSIPQINNGSRYF